MRTSLKSLLCMSAGLLIVAGAADAKTAKLVPIIPFPGASSTSVFGIADDNNTIAGSYVSSDGLTHGFYGTLDGNYTSFDFGDSGFTQARGIDPSGTAITGFSNNDGVHCDFQEWEKTGSGNPKQIKKGKKTLAGIVQGLNSAGVFSGDHCEKDGVTVIGETGQSGKWTADVTTPFGGPYTGERGVNTHGDLAGFYVDSDTQLQVGTYIHNGTTNQVIYPDANEVYTVLEGLNDDNVATGQWQDSGGIVHSFSYNAKKSTFTEIDDPNAGSFTQAWGINSSGLIAVSSDAGAYIYCPATKEGKRDCPSGGMDIAVREIHVSPGQMLRYGAGKKGHAAPAKVVLPKGAALQ